MTEFRDVLVDVTEVSFEGIFESLPDPVAVCDDEGNILALNQQARSYLGVSVGTAVKLDLRARETVRQIRLHTNPTGAEFFLADVSVDGASRSRVSASFHPIAPGKNYRVLFASGPDGRVQSPNVRMMESLVNVGRHLELFKSPEKTLALFAASFADVFPTYSFRIILADGSLHDHGGWQGARSTPPDPTADLSVAHVPEDELCFVGAGRGWRVPVRNDGVVQIERADDVKFGVSERQAFETFAQQLGLSMPRQENGAIGAVGPIIDQLDAIVVVCDSRRHVLVSNRTFERLVATSEIVGRDVLEFFDGADRARIRTGAASVMAGGEAEAFEAHIGSTNDNQVALRLQIAPASGRDGDGASGFVITGQQSELSLMELEERMTRAEQLMNLGQLATGVAHELKNPLTSILNYAEYLLMKYQGSFFEERDSERLRRIIEGVERIDAFVKDLVVLARPNDGEAQLVSLHGVVHESGLMCEVALSQAGATLSLDLDRSEPIVNGHRNQLKQVLVNLVANAAKSMPEGGGAISVRTRVDEEMVCCQVIDDAAGMSEETLSRIFEPFFTTREGRGGSGLGLALVQTIVRRHGGDIAVDSELGKGTTFTISLPLARR